MLHKTRNRLKSLSNLSLYFVYKMRYLSCSKYRFVSLHFEREAKTSSVTFSWHMRMLNGEYALV